MNNFDKFQEQLEKEYTELFKTPEYSYSASRTTPKSLAEKMTASLKAGSANKDGDGIKRTCKHFGVKYTYKDIQQFLSV